MIKKYLLLFLILASFIAPRQAEATWWTFGKAGDIPEISSLFIGNVDIVHLEGDELLLDNSNLDGDMVTIKGFAVKAEAPLAVANISLDGGQTWEDVTIESGGVFIYSFKPEEGKEYKPQFKIMDTAGKESDLRDSPRFTLIYTSINLRQAIDETLHAMIQAYTSKSLSRFSTYLSDSFRGDIFALEEAIESDFRLFDSINIDISIQQVFKAGNEIKVDFDYDWFGNRKADGNLISPERDSTSYIFRQENGGYKLLSMASPIIFGVSDPDIGTGGGGGEPSLAGIWSGTVTETFETEGDGLDDDDITFEFDQLGYITSVTWEGSAINTKSGRISGNVFTAATTSTDTDTGEHDTDTFTGTVSGNTITGTYSGEEIGKPSDNWRGDFTVTKQ